MPATNVSVWRSAPKVPSEAFHRPTPLSCTTHFSDRVKPCSEMKCPPGTVCELGQVICPFVPPCFTKPTKCVPLSTLVCMFHLWRLRRCSGTGNWSSLVWARHNSRFCVSVPKETCATKKCPPGTVCEQEQIFCVRAPCPQPKPQCVRKG